MEKLQSGLDLSVERLLKRKAALEQSVVYSDGQGDILTLSGQEALEHYLAEKGKNMAD